MSARDNGFNDAISSPISKNRDIRVTAFGITTLKIFRMKKRCRFPNHRLILQLNQHFFDEINKLRSSKKNGPPRSVYDHAPETYPLEKDETLPFAPYSRSPA